MTWMPTWFHFLEVRLRSCVEGWVEQTARPSSQHKLVSIFAQNNQDLTSMIVNHVFNDFLRSKSWEFASMLGLANMTRTCSHDWDSGSIWTNPKTWPPIGLPLIHLIWHSRGVHSLLHFAYMCVRDLFIGGRGLFTLQKKKRWWYFTCKKHENIICDRILHVNMFHYLKIPYFTCTFFTKFTYNEFFGPYFLSHVVLWFSPVNSPRWHWLNWFGLFETNYVVKWIT
jgi:hypothetical protein